MSLKTVARFIDEYHWLLVVQVQQPLPLCGSETSINLLSLLSGKKSLAFVPPDPTANDRFGFAKSFRQARTIHSEEIKRVKAMIDRIHTCMLIFHSMQNILVQHFLCFVPIRTAIKTVISQLLNIIV